MSKEKSNEQEKSDDQVFDVDRIRELIELMKEHDLSEVDLRQNENRIRLRRGPDNLPVMTIPGAMPSPSLGTAPAPVADGSTATENEPDNAVYITSPTVGTFYSKPNPDTKPFVSVGDMVSPDTVVCLVEAMKMYNEIPAGVSGRIVACLVENEEAVDVNKPLFRVEPS